MEHAREVSDLSFLNEFENELGADPDGDSPKTKPVKPTLPSTFFTGPDDPPPPPSDPIPLSDLDPSATDITSSGTPLKQKRRSTKAKKSHKQDDGEDTDTDDEEDDKSKDALVVGREASSSLSPKKIAPLASTNTAPLGSPTRSAALSTSNSAATPTATTRPAALSTSNSSSSPPGPAIPSASPAAAAAGGTRKVSNTDQPPVPTRMPTTPGVRERASSNRPGASSVKKEVPAPLSPGPLDTHADLASLTRGRSKTDALKDPHMEHYPLSPTKQDHDAAHPHTAIPSSPRLGGVEGGKGSVKVFFGKPFSDGGKKIDHYKVKVIGGDGYGEEKVIIGHDSPIVIPDLKAGVSYRFVVTANNEVGDSPPSETSIPIVLMQKKSFFCCVSTVTDEDSSLTNEHAERKASKASKSSKASSASATATTTASQSSNASTSSASSASAASNASAAADGASSPKSESRKRKDKEKKQKQKSMQYEDDEFIEEIRKLGVQSRTIVYTVSDHAPLV